MTMIDTIEIEGLIWVDKWAWSSVEASEKRAVDGSLVVEMGRKIKGRPITLGGSETVWLDQSKLAQLQALAEKGQAFSLTRGTETINVMFRYSDPPFIDVVQLYLDSDTENPERTEILYVVNNIKLIEV